MLILKETIPAASEDLVNIGKGLLKSFDYLTVS